MNYATSGENTDNIVCICVDEKDDQIAKGKIYNCYDENPLVFEDASEILFLLESFFDKMNFPQASTKSRFFLQGNRDSSEVGREREKPMSSKDVTNQKGTKGTFVVHVQYRQNATWQGSVVWAEKNITKNFRSALELLKLIDGALDESETTE